jgi:UDP-3-O-[3-hydroxymyristoyl] glucosamine N-acyltransferase
MKFTAAQIAGILEGEVIGNPDALVFKLAKIDEGTEGSLTFLANPKYVNFIYTTQATITIVNNDFVPENELATTLIKVEDAYQSFSKILEYYNQVKLMKSGIEQPSVISENVIYGDQLYLGSFSYVGKNVTIGNNVKIYPNCFIGDNVTIGDNCVFFAGVKILGYTSIADSYFNIGFFHFTWIGLNIIPDFLFNF